MPTSGTPPQHYRYGRAVRNIVTMTNCRGCYILAQICRRPRLLNGVYFDELYRALCTCTNLSSCSSSLPFPHSDLCVVVVIVVTERLAAVVCWTYVLNIHDCISRSRHRVANRLDVYCV